VRNSAKRRNPVLHEPRRRGQRTALLWRNAGRYGCALLCLLTATANAQVTGDLNTNSGNTNSTIDSGNISTSETKNYNGAGSSPFSTPVPTAAAPTVMGGGGNDSCLIPYQQAFQVSIFGRAEGKMEQDVACNRRKDSRLLGTPQEAGGLGLQVSGISLMCGDAAIFKAMALASTPCPIYSIATGKLLVGREGYLAMRDEPHTYVVGYAQDQAFWDAFLMMNEELPDVVAQENSGPTLSERFRRTRRADDDQPSGVSPSNP
jgi:hypothetical protein